MKAPSDTKVSGPAPGGGGRKIQEGIDRRPQADELIRGWWRSLPLVAVAFGLGGFLAFVLLLPGVDGLVFGYIVMYIAGFAMLAILTYKQTRRLSLHAAREGLVREGMLDRLRSLNESNASGEVKSEIAALEGLHAEATKQEALPNQTYAAMSALPLVGPVIAYYYLFRLERLTRGHDERWRRMVQGYSSAMKSLGRPAPNVPGPTMARRHFVLYLVISLAFFPFLAYWYDVMVREVNQHFQEQWKVEDALASST